MNATRTIYVEYLNRPHGGRIPWYNATVAYKGKSERTALRTYRRLFRLYYPEPNTWAGHVRITDDTHQLEATPGLPRICRLIDA